jgi:hypothetical protein
MGRQAVTEDLELLKQPLIFGLEGVAMEDLCSSLGTELLPPPCIAVASFAVVAVMSFP